MNAKTAIFPALLLLGSGLTGGCSPNLGAERHGGINVTISGEALATDGIRFPTGSEVTLVDGWSLELQHVLVTVGNVTLADDPDLMPSDQSRLGDTVAVAKGPWAVDLHAPGSALAAGGEGLATLLTRIDGQTERGGIAFEGDQRYGFSYDVVPASSQATIVNFGDDAEARSAYEDMIASGATVLYAGTATFRGTDCTSQDPSYAFSQIPPKLDFRLLFVTPTSFLNCQNQDNQGAPFEGEEYQRGIAIPRNGDAVAQITLHLEHAFFSALLHDPPLRFDQLAARLVSKPAGSVLTLDDLVGVDPSAFTDGAGAPLPARSCDGSPLPVGHQLSFDHGSVPLDPGASPARALRDYRDFIQYVQSTQGHLNGGEGLCYVSRRYASPI